MSFNSTLHSTASALYAQAGTDFSSLSWLETQWAAWYMWIGNPVLATGIMSFVMHEVLSVRLSYTIIPDHACRSSTLAVAFHGSLWTTCNIFASGSCSQYVARAPTPRLSSHLAH